MNFLFSNYDVSFFFRKAGKKTYERGKEENHNPRKMMTPLVNLYLELSVLVSHRNILKLYH